MSEKHEFDRKMKTLRRRRLFMGFMIAIYIPMIWTVLSISQSDKITGIFFAIWVLIVAVAANLTAFSRCPSCGNFFHMNGPIPMYLRHCLHCGMHISGDERRNHFNKKKS